MGLLPIAVSGADIDQLMAGAAAGRERALNAAFEENDAMQYAAVRNILLRKGKQVEILANYEPSLTMYLSGGNSSTAGKRGQGPEGNLPASVDLTTDLHSMGQFIQDGNRIMYETVMNVEESKEEIVIQ